MSRECVVGYGSHRLGMVETGVCGWLLVMAAID